MEFASLSVLGLFLALTPTQVEGPSREAIQADHAPGQPPEAKPFRLKRWSLHIAPGIMYAFAGDMFSAVGPDLRVGGWIQSWYGNLMVGGGPVAQYTYVADTAAEDHIHMMTVGGDFLLGGGRANRWAAYSHLTLNAGLAYGHDGATDTDLLVPWGRLTGGAGLHGYVSPNISLGALCNVGWFGGVGIEAFATVGFHFDGKGDISASSERSRQKVQPTSPAPTNYGIEVEAQGPTAHPPAANEDDPSPEGSEAERPEGPREQRERKRRKKRKDKKKWRPQERNRVRLL